MEEELVDEGLRSRRRLVQATLFPNSGKQIPVKGGAEEEEEDEEEEWCESQENGNKTKGKQKKKKRNSKTTTPQSHSRASKKVALSGKETSSKEIPDGDSPVTIKTDFFLKISERKNQKRQRHEQLNIGSPEKLLKSCSPPANKKTPRSKKKLASSTPKKCQLDVTGREEVLISGSMETCLVPRNLMQDESMLHSMPDLRMEARKTAEEDSRRYAGKQIHPFFQSCKMGKKSQEVIDVESNWYSSEEGKSLSFSPIHVFEIVTEDETAFDWGHWIFSEASFLDNDVVLECGSSSFSEGSFTLLQFDNFSCISYPKKTLSQQNKIELNQPTISQDEVVSDHSSRETKLYPAALSVVAEEQVSHCEQLKKAEVANVVDTVDSPQNNLSSDAKKQGRFFQERIVSDYQISPTRPKSCLWTNKYQPERAFQVCGNSEPVKLLSDWLHLWHEKASRTSKPCILSDRVTQDSFDSLYESEADSTNEEQLKNVLLVSGPVGSGKSAAIYACAKEQGFQVIEVNSSDWRNGALVKQKFGEAVESHWLQRIQKDPAYVEDKLVSGGGVIEVIPLSDEENAPTACGVQRKQVWREEITPNHQGETKTLILFEDVDTALCEDRGFVSTIQQLAETAKRPMILTSNSDNPVLPNNLDRLQVCFALPSLKELLELAHMVCAREQVKIHPMLVEGFVNYCHGDIRKTIMYLQFWCQGQTLKKDNDLQLRYSPLQFDLEAGHLLLPKIIPWDFASPLSELVDEEITKSMRVDEERYCTNEEAEEVELNNITEENNSRDLDMGANNVDGKKDAMLTLLYSFQDHNECTLFGTNSEFSDASESPIAFTRRNTLRKLDRVMSSDSEEECSRVPVSLDQPEIGNEEIETACSSPSHFSATEISCSLPTENFHFKAKRLKRNYLETADYSTVNVVSKSVNVSCVPESSFIPETQLTIDSELISSTESYNDVDVKVEANYCSNLSLPSMYSLKVEKLDENILLSSEYQELQGCSSDRITKSIPGEVVEHFNGQCMEDVPSGYRVLDECSRMDFIKSSTSFKTTVEFNLNTSVQDTWKRLREGYLDLRQYITPEQKEASQILNVAHEMSDLISVADLLLADCKHLLYDSLEPSMIPIEESHSYNWHDDQLQMSSIFAQHGVCLFAKEIASLGPNTASVYEVDLAWEMLTSTNSTMALGKMVGQSRRKHEGLHLRLPRTCHSFRSKADLNAYNLLQSVVPLRSHIALKGDSFHEYLSSLSQISRFGTTRLSESIGRRKQRRARAAQHYLSSGRLALSQDDVSLLGQYNCYQKVSPGSGT
ncbi:PREDICTED: uncharacterized protein LOC109214488 [Nicotiana attenuata]|uniref:AAA+ ATPase domain-containing protein n=1 Tax=Nicotiana attenuata TaxID=49451 RepID=A0A1J6KAF6_NICAT|nr:PREDICTED: uncharacterized protein LOC109214488 [Nicotiana attenuata]OIT27058.1 hypothetical protein A4A49_23513 [Nicotiana attenuata]